MSEELKPCPFGKDHTTGICSEYNIIDEEHNYWRTCYNCGARGPIQSSELMANIVWNTRAGESE
jgi:hypothetical protein